MKGSPQKRTAPLSRARKMPNFERPEPVFDKSRLVLTPPLEITRAMLKGLNMVDETIIVRDERERKGSIAKEEQA